MKSLQEFQETNTIFLITFSHQQKHIYLIKQKTTRQYSQFITSYFRFNINFTIHN